MSPVCQDVSHPWRTKGVKSSKRDIPGIEIRMENLLGGTTVSIDERTITAYTGSEPVELERLYPILTQYTLKRSGSSDSQHGTRKSHKPFLNAVVHLNPLEDKGYKGYKGKRPQPR
eukprot:397383-Pelagomonas_calceolata.AAC.1